MLLDILELGGDLEAQNPATKEAAFFRIRLQHSLELWEILCSVLPDINHTDQEGKNLLYRMTEEYRDQYALRD